MTHRNPPRPPRSSHNDARRPRLHLSGGPATLDEPKGSSAIAEQAQNDAIPFPVTDAARSRLLAGVVRVPARPELATQDPVIGRIGHDRLVRSIEATLAQMQSNLDQLDADVDAQIEAEIEASLKFPSFSDDPGPRAA